jgi:hypothetical protein
VLIRARSACFSRCKYLYVCCRREEKSRNEQKIYILSLGADAQTEHRVDESEFFFCVYAVRMRPYPHLLLILINESEERGKPYHRNEFPKFLVQRHTTLVVRF